MGNIAGSVGASIARYSAVGMPSSSIASSVTAKLVACRISQNEGMDSTSVPIAASSSTRRRPIASERRPMAGRLKATSTIAGIVSRADCISSGPSCVPRNVGM